MSIYFWDGVILFDSGKIAMHVNCCCGCPCYDGEIPTTTWLDGPVMVDAYCQTCETTFDKTYSADIANCGWSTFTDVSPGDCAYPLKSKFSWGIRTNLPESECLLYAKLIIPTPGPQTIEWQLELPAPIVAFDHTLPFYHQTDTRACDAYGSTVYIYE